MFALLLLLLFVTFIASVIWVSFKLGTTKTDNPKLCAIIGGTLAIIPPLALIYLVVLLFKEDTSLV
jgi:hypothetical protein